MSNTEEPDQKNELYSRLAAGDRGAFDAIVARARSALLRFAQGRLKKVPEVEPAYDAEDAIQSGFRELWRGILNNKLRPPDGYDMFLRLARTIIGRRILARARKERGPKAASLPPQIEHWSTGPLIGLVPDQVDLFDIGVPSEEAAVIARDEFQFLMNLLGPDLRPVIEHRLEGLTIAQIASQLKISSSTVERRLKEAIYIWHEAARRRRE